MEQDFKDRLRIIRKSLPQRTSQEAFAKSLGLTRTAYNKYELGLVVPSDTFIQLLCSKFNVNEEWLRTGNGKMPQESEAAMFSAFVQKYNLSEKEQQAARYLLALSSEERQQILRHVEGIARAIQTDEGTSSEMPVTTLTKPAAEVVESPESDEYAAKRAEAYRQVDAGIYAEQKGQSASTSGNSAAKTA